MPSEVLVRKRTESDERDALDRDPRAMTAVMRRYNRRLFRIARSILDDDAEAEDVVQETYLKVFLKGDDYRADGSFAAWIGRIALNLALSRRRALGRRPDRGAPPGGELDGLPPQPGVWCEPAAASPERAAALGELRRLMEQEIDRLGESYRAVFVLRVVEGLSVEETAGLLQLAPGTVKTRLHRAQRQIRRALDGRLSAATLEAFPFDGRRCDGVVVRVLERVAAAAGS